jgi:hypothetical protein
MRGKVCVPRLAAPAARPRRTRARAVLWIGAACSVCAWGASACRAPGAERPPDERYAPIRPQWRDGPPDVSREWLSFSLGWLARDTEDADPVGDGVALGVDGGFDLARTVLTPAIELGAGYTHARVDEAGVDDVDLWRLTAGLRGTWHGASFRPYARAGGFVRFAADDLEEPYDPYATGVYAGLGFDWPYQAGMHLGPRITWFRALDEDAPGGEAAEWVFALAATFRL